MYVYAAVEGAPRALPAHHMPHAAPPRALTLDARLSLVVSDVPAATYAPSALEPRLSDLDWVSAAGAAHHAVVEALADAGEVVLPFRLFSVYSSDDKAREVIGATRRALARGFDRVRGREEWVLRISKPEAPPAANLDEPAPGASPPATGTAFLAAKAGARRAAAERARRVQEDAAACTEALERMAEASRRRSTEPGGTLLTDTALLVPPDRVEALHATLTRTAERLLRDGCTVSLTGPWPPYSFASLDAEGHG